MLILIARALQCGDGDESFVSILAFDDATVVPPRNGQLTGRG